VLSFHSQQVCIAKHIPSQEVKLCKLHSGHLSSPLSHFVQILCTSDIIINIVNYDNIAFLTLLPSLTLYHHVREHGLACKV
jgi:hypothetical protein